MMNWLHRIKKMRWIKKKVASHRLTSQRGMLFESLESRAVFSADFGMGIDGWLDRNEPVFDRNPHGSFRTMLRTEPRESFGRGTHYAESFYETLGRHRFDRPQLRAEGEQRLEAPPSRPIIEIVLPHQEPRSSTLSQKSVSRNGPPSEQSSQTSITTEPLRIVSRPTLQPANVADPIAELGVADTKPSSAFQSPPVFNETSHSRFSSIAASPTALESSAALLHWTDVNHYMASVEHPSDRDPASAFDDRAIASRVSSDMIGLPFSNDSTHPTKRSSSRWELNRIRSLPLSPVDSQVHPWSKITMNDVVPLPLPKGMVYLQVGECEDVRKAISGSANREMMASVFPMGLLQMFVGMPSEQASPTSTRGHESNNESRQSPLPVLEMPSVSNPLVAGIVASALWLRHVTAKRLRRRSDSKTKGNGRCVTSFD